MFGVFTYYGKPKRVQLLKTLLKTGWLKIKYQIIHADT